MTKQMWCCWIVTKNKTRTGDGDWLDVEEVCCKRWTRPAAGSWKRETDGDDGHEVNNGNELQAELVRLRKENQRLKLEREILKKAAAFFARAIGVRYQMIAAEKKAYPAALLCDVMQVSRSGYYSWRNREKSPSQQEYERLIPVVQEADKISKHTYGARRIAKEVEELGISCGKTKAMTLMKLANVSAKQKKKCNYPACTDESQLVALTRRP